MNYYPTLLPAQWLTSPLPGLRFQGKLTSFTRDHVSFVCVPSQTNGTKIRLIRYNLKMEETNFSFRNWRGYSNVAETTRDVMPMLQNVSMRRPLAAQ